MDGWASVDAAVLAGGLGTRLRAAIDDRPKVLADVAGRPFLAYVLDHLADQGVRRVVLCTGYLGEQVEAAFGTRYRGLTLAYSREPAPLGTGGALRLALPKLSTDDVLVMNGDSLCTAPLSPMLSAHRRRRAQATLLLTRVDDAERYGTVLLDDEGREKGTTGPGLVSSGVYLLRRDLLAGVPTGRSISIERELFPSWIGPNMYGYVCEQPFVDIGLPSSLTQARQTAETVGSPV
jgi:D-glycero-alpha-D-manno-heptose 1-phosphate guanylyltransferase